jgi:DHA1 family inner membrane transport protein
MSVSAYNLGTAVGSGVAGATLGTGLGAVGPVVVGTAVAALTLVPTTALALAGRRRSPGPALSPARAPG